MKKSFSAIIFSVAIIVSAFVLGNAIINRNKPQSSIAVTGLGKANFTSDLIVWEGSFTSENVNLKEAYNNL